MKSACTVSSVFLLVVGSVISMALPTQTFAESAEPSASGLGIAALAGFDADEGGGGAFGVEVNYLVVPALQLGGEYAYSTVGNSLLAVHGDYYFTQSYYAGVMAGAISYSAENSTNSWRYSDTEPLAGIETGYDFVVSSQVRVGPKLELFQIFNPDHLVDAPGRLLVTFRLNF